MRPWPGLDVEDRKGLDIAVRGLWCYRGSMIRETENPSDKWLLRTGEESSQEDGPCIQVTFVEVKSDDIESSAILILIAD